MKYRAAIVGLGQVGMLFDLDTKRSGVWTHFGAYEKLSELYDLVAVCDPDVTRGRLAMGRKSDIRYYENIEDLLNAEELDVVSICTPANDHLRHIMNCCGRVKGVICEKPLGGGFLEAVETVSACEARGTLLLVNYYKRFDGAVPQMRALLEQAKIGTLSHINGLYSGTLDGVGSHMLDLCLYLFGGMTLQAESMMDQQWFSAVYRLNQGATLVMNATGCRSDLIFEIDVIGSEGRLRLLDNCARLETWSFQISRRYDQYRELYLEPCEGGVVSERFLPLFVEMYEGLSDRRSQYSSDGKSALASQSLLSELVARENSRCQRT